MQRQLLFFKITLFLFQHVLDGSVSAPFTETAYRVKYFKPIPKEINQDTQQFRRRFFFHFTLMFD